MYIYIQGMGASMGKNCDTLTYDEYKDTCGDEAANLAKGKCPSINVTKSKCKDVCISNDENSCKGYSIKSSSGGKYIDSQGNCVNIPSGNCPP